jgi:hypothetical protein
MTFNLKLLRMSLNNHKEVTEDPWTGCYTGHYLLIHSLYKIIIIIIIITITFIYYGTMEYDATDFGR